jgi:hypothetical protein
MKSKGHLIISLIKPFIRIGGILLSFKYNNITIALYSLAVAEILGITEELCDFRG